MHLSVGLSGPSVAPQTKQIAEQIAGPVISVPITRAELSGPITSGQVTSLLSPTWPTPSPSPSRAGLGPGPTTPDHARRPSSYHRIPSSKSRASTNSSSVNLGTTRITRERRHLDVPSNILWNR
jgi:hypothetical protein